MASSNRHWPSMFKSKPCNTTTNSATTTTTTTPPQWQHDINHACLVSSSQRPSPYSSSSGCEERTPEPKPRWNPKPEQIRILETIFNSGLVNPPRDEIRRIRAQLQEYGQVGDANVFYWFQNRKSRSKHKQKHLQNTKSSSSTSSSSSSSSPSSSHVNKTTTSALSLTAPSSSSSSSSEKSSPPMCIDNKPFPMGAPTSVSNLIDVSNSPTASVNQLTYFQSSGEFTPHHHDPFFFPMQQTGGNNNNNSTIFSSTQGFCFSHNTFPPGTTEQSIGGTCSGHLLDELMLNHGVVLRKDEYLEQNRKFLQEQQQLNYMMTTTTNAAAASTTLVPTTSMITTTSSVAVPISTTTSSTTASTIINQIQGGGVGESSNAMGGPAAAAKSTVFINDVAIEISVGPLNVRQTFGDDVVLIHPSGQPVLTNEWGVTLHSLTPGAFYYLVPITCCLVEED